MQSVTIIAATLKRQNSTVPWVGVVTLPRYHTIASFSFSQRVASLRVLAKQRQATLPRKWIIMVAAPGQAVPDDYELVVISLGPDAASTDWCLFRKAVV